MAGGVIRSQAGAPVLSGSLGMDGMPGWRVDMVGKGSTISGPVEGCSSGWIQTWQRLLKGLGEASVRAPKLIFPNQPEVPAGS